MHDWALSLKQRYPDKPVAVACELKKGPLIYALNRYEHITIFPINPSTVTKCRNAFTQSGAKNDPSDALIQTEILTLHMDKLHPIQPETADVRILAQLVEYRRKIVQDRVNLSNCITAILKNYYPQALEWFKEKDTIIFCDFVLRWPSLADSQKVRKQTLMNFFNQHNSRYPAINEKRFTNIKTACALTTDPAVIEPNKIMIEVLIPQLKLLIEAIERLDLEIKKYYKTQDDCFIFDS